MYLHLGNDVLINSKDLIGIFDIENSSISKYTKSFLNFAAKNNRVVTVSYEMPKSFIVCLDKDLNEKVYISQISCATLKKRFQRYTVDLNFDNSAQSLLIEKANSADS